MIIFIVYKERSYINYKIRNNEDYVTQNSKQLYGEDQQNN